MPDRYNNSNWPPETVERLKVLWAEGKSGSEIAKELGNGLSRSSILGKAYRLGLPTRDAAKASSNAQRHKAFNTWQGMVKTPGRKPKDGSRKKPAKRVTLPALPINRPEISADAPPPRAAAFMALPGTTPKSLIDLAAKGECRWPIGENPTLFCGCAADGTYCATHAAMAYRPLEKADK